MLRIQQYVEMVRTKDYDKIVREAIPHMKKYIIPLKDKYPDEIAHLAGLIAYPPDTQVGVYKVRQFLPPSSDWRKSNRV